MRSVAVETLRALAVLVAVCALTSVISGVSAARAVSAQAAIAGADLVARLAQGKPVDESGVHVDGDVDLRSVPAVTAEFRCRACSLTGSLLADGIAFRSVVDLGGSTIGGDLSARGTLFDRGAVFTGVHVDKATSLGLAVFSETADFAGADLIGPVGLSGALFKNASSFAGTDFQDTADFSGAVFSGDASFAGVTLPPGGHGTAAALCSVPIQGVFVGAVTFTRTVFGGRADFPRRCFAAEADFTSAVLHGPAEFDDARFVRGAVFDRAGFGADAVFTSATFDARVRFDGVRADHDLSFGGAGFTHARTEFGLADATVAGALRLDLATAPVVLDIDGTTAADVKMDPARAAQVIAGPRAQMQILALVEKTARAAGDGNGADDAHYRHLTIAARQRSGAWAAFQDGFLYRDVGGYLVRPLAPIRAFAILLGIGIFVRLFRDTGPGILHRLLAAIDDTSRSAFALKFPERPDPAQASVGTWAMAAAVLQRMEHVAFKILIVVAIICIASANATAQQFITTFTGGG